MQRGAVRSTQQVLEEELERIQRILRLGTDLKARWVPNRNSELSGEVKNEIIYVYEEDEEVAKETLKHEVIDYVISQVDEPYKEVCNKLISLLNEDAYKRKEKLAEALARLLDY